MARILSAQFFSRTTLSVARDLLGKILVRRYKKSMFEGIITEVEAYDGLSDLASHARRGQTKRNAPMFGGPGVWYVYFTYGMHWMLNVSTREAGYPAAVLIRGIYGASGPGRLTKAFKIDGKLSGLPASKKSGLWIEDRRTKIPQSKIKASPRIGISYAGPYWAKRKWRFYIS